MIKKGEILLSEKPFVFVLKSSLLKQRCNHCFASSEVKKCSQCHYVSYCGKNCQRSAWALHKLECSKLAKTLPNILPDSAHLLIRLILKLKISSNQDSNICQNKYKAKNRPFSDLMSHYDELLQDQRRMEHFRTLIMLLGIFFNDEENLDEDEILQLFGKMCINSFNILDNDMNSIGTGMYLAASILDHSCEPNAVAIFEGTTIYIRTIKNLKRFDWSNIRISYIDVLNLTSHRKKELQSMYYFLCDCERCRDQEEGNLMNSMACPNKNCSGFVHVPENISDKLSCAMCRSIVSKARIDKFQEITPLSDYHLQNMKSKDMAYIDVCEMTLKKQINVLHEYNVRRVKIMDLAFEACINLERWEDAFKYGRQLLPGFRKYYRNHHPLVGLLNMKLLKLALLQDDLFAAKSYYNEAKEILLVSHGSHHSLYASLQEVFCS
ncbi:uncharacterized protein Smyd3 [Planococcus citri]|uniref:uncharacterized protein Smyd3 n=1 Tax=Planococcus citri TaxID=170843 RepID=UPI0031F73137